jgi:hypothetical protein
MIEKLMEAMIALIAKHELKLMQTYPEDLTVHDRRLLEQYMVSGATIAWVVGHTHTHLVPLGIHPKQNAMVRYLTNLSSSDHFFLIECSGNDFRITELKREVFESLGAHPIKYSIRSIIENFSLYKGERLIGGYKVQILPHQPGSANPRRKVIFSPASGISDFERIVLSVWGDHTASESAGTMFVRVETEWPALPPTAPVQQLQPAHNSMPCHVH